MTASTGQALQSIFYEDGSLKVLDQLLLPHKQSYIAVETVEDGWRVIKNMIVRGAPAIAIVAVLSLATEIYRQLEADTLPSDAVRVASMISEKLKYVSTSRTTAVNLNEAAVKLSRRAEQLAKHENVTGRDVAMDYHKAAVQMIEDDIQTNREIGRHGAEWIVKHVERDTEREKIATVQRVSADDANYRCPGRSLATAGYGTALGVIRALHSSGHIRHAYCTETRPYLQGARLTAFELLHEKIPSTLITDSMVGALLADKSKGIDAIIVGADRVAANGDTANKIGTYSLAVLAQFHGVKFLVAAPRTSIDMSTPSGMDIKIEQRAKTELINVTGFNRADIAESGKLHSETIAIAPEQVHVWNPSFDVTPAFLIDGIVTESGVFVKDASGRFGLDRLFC
ncbi:S-methyl-5-thioribose-1-phosphate isomerase [Ascosphaera aggregata]|nr:S-methyl-5-thioribose-1-phosphate isomerase [Ascosphaera aggregata]